MGVDRARPGVLFCRSLAHNAPVAKPVILALPRPLGGDGVLRAVEPAAVLWQQADAAYRRRNGRSERVSDLLAALEEELSGGGRAVGFFGYEFCPSLDALIRVPAGPRPLPDAWWVVLPERGRVDSIEPGAFTARGPLRESLDATAFAGRVETIRDAIAEGSVYQANLTRRWEVPFSGDPAGLFKRLVSGEAPRFATLLADRELGFAVICLSPELLLRRRRREVETRPIKGTRPRGADAGEDARQAAALASSEKDAAELAMIIDLERNDLNRVCRPGSVRVLGVRTVRTADVIHREARVVGTLEDGVSWRALLAALLPGGSVTGAPKLAACGMIAELEPVPRSTYCGALGVLTATSAVLALPIRTGCVSRGMLRFHSGCGIVFDSDPTDEEAESRAKVASWFAVLGR